MDKPKASVQRYHPLEDEAPTDPHSPEHLQWGIRLLRLLPGTRDAPIHCSLSISTIGKSLGEFEALSYTWGNPSVTTTIWLNEKPVPVTRNLGCALRCLRNESSPRYMWVDAVCIDQSSNKEKSAQVPRMWAIYSFSRRTLVFLGDEADDSGEAMKLLIQLSEIRPRDIDVVGKLLCNPDLAMSWTALLRLMERQYWLRAWIIQEYAVAKELHFLCGLCAVTGQQFSRALKILVDYRFEGKITQEHSYLVRHVASTSVHHLWSTREAYQQGKQYQRALDVLYKFRRSMSYDPRDKIFSLYKLMGKIPALKPDYSRPTVDVYQDVVRTAIDSSKNLEILSHHNRTVTSQLVLPTWCPDWTVMRGKRILLWPNGYRACGIHKAQPSISERKLTLTGVCVAEVKVLARFPAARFKDGQDIYDELHKIHEKVRNAVELGTEESRRLDAFRRTIVASRIRKSGPQGSVTILDDYMADDYWNAWSCLGNKCGAALSDKAKWYDDAIFSALCGRAFVITNNGHLGLVDEPVEEGDEVCIFAGGEVPLCVRAFDTISNQKRYQLIGECYLHGYMGGEAFSAAGRDQSPLREFDIM